jgi:hypothetical protein
VAVAVLVMTLTAAAALTSGPVLASAIGIASVAGYLLVGWRWILIDLERETIGSLFARYAGSLRRRARSVA